MNTRREAREDYRRQIRRWTRALAVARPGEVLEDVLDSADDVKLFTDGNLDKRFMKLQDQLELVDEAVDDLAEWIDRYVRRIPLAAYDTGHSDVDNFLQWLCGQRDLTAEQRDYVDSQRCRCSVERQAETRRAAHVRFQELLAASDRLCPRWEREVELCIHLNPLRARTTLRTRALLDEESAPPAAVVFFPVGNQIHTAVLEPEAIRIVRLLEELGPCRQDRLLESESTHGRDEVIEIGRDLAETGLAAFGPNTPDRKRKLIQEGNPGRQCPGHWQCPGRYPTFF